MNKPEDETVVGEEVVGLLVVVGAEVGFLVLVGEEVGAADVGDKI